MVTIRHSIKGRTKMCNIVTHENANEIVKKVYDIKLNTVNDCADLYNKAPDIAEQLKDGLQGMALLEAKKLICGDEWDAKKPTKAIGEKWVKFYSMLGAKKENVNKLLDFAGYREGGGKIEKASHYRETKKITVGVEKKPTAQEVDEKYDELGGEKLETAKAITDAEFYETEKHKHELTQETYHRGERYSDSQRVKIQEIILYAWSESLEMEQIFMRDRRTIVILENALKIIKSDYPHDEKIKLIKDKKYCDDIFNDGGAKEKAKNFKDAQQQNKTLREENAILKKRNRELEAKQRGYDFCFVLDVHLRHLREEAQRFKEASEKSSKVFNNMRPHIENALKVLRLPTEDESTFEEIKRAYRDEAKKAHPDAGGTAEHFHNIKKAYDILKGALDG